MLQGEKKILQNLPPDERVVGTDLILDIAPFLKRKKSETRPKIMQKKLNPTLNGSLIDSGRNGSKSASELLKK